MARRKEIYGLPYRTMSLKLTQFSEQNFPVIFIVHFAFNSYRNNALLVLPSNESITFYLT